MTDFRLKVNVLERKRRGVKRSTNTCKIRALASSEGWGNSIFRSSRPDRINAGSKISARFVAAITYTGNKLSQINHLIKATQNINTCIYLSKSN